LRMVIAQLPARKRVALFEYPALPKYEIGFYLSVIFVGFFFAWYAVNEATNQFERLLADDLPIPRHYIPFFGYRYKDESNWEWGRWSPFALSFLPYLAVSCLIFNVGEKFLSESVMPYVMIAYSAFACSQLFTGWLVVVSILQGTFIFAMATFTKRSLVVWVSGLPILYMVMNNSLDFNHDPFLVLIFASYTLLSYISFSLETVKENLRDEDNTVWKRYVRMLFYTFYLPYVISLVVTYPDFEKQMSERATRQRNWLQILWFAIRIAIYWVAVEVMLHIFYFEAMLNDPEFSYTLREDLYLAACMAFGQFFHLKYVVIFGVPAVFAKIDNMKPQKGPICMAAVALYSKMWRNFDRGLYSFFKQYIFIPIAAPTFSLSRKIFAVFVCYGFVLIWHGFNTSNYIWISLSISELFLEYLGKGIYSIESVRKWREEHIGDVAFRRIVAVLQEITMIPAIYGNYFFVCGPFIAYQTIERIWFEETLKLQYPLFILLILGYIYVQMVLEIERQKSLCRKRRDDARKKEMEEAIEQEEQNDDNKDDMAKKVD
uniref:Protein-cysteine N-palmitoyltransferase HHAT (inferred by orthology to a human protein) n=1 Tax=Anisakis simplex TaxID=6269 RepID=A0A0M3J026_ANISI